MARSLQPGSALEPRSPGSGQFPLARWACGCGLPSFYGLSPCDPFLYLLISNRSLTLKPSCLTSSFLLHVLPAFPSLLTQTSSHEPSFVVPCLMFKSPTCLYLSFKSAISSSSLLLPCPQYHPVCITTSSHSSSISFSPFPLKNIFPSHYLCPHH